MSIFSKKTDQTKETEAKKEAKDLTLAELKEVKEKETTGGVKKAKHEDTKESYRLIVKPLVTEKGTYLAGDNKYLFEVYPAATKVTIKKAIAALYGVQAVKVNIIRNIGKKVRYGKTRGKTKAVKKAIVTLKKGETIQVYEGV